MSLVQSMGLPEQRFVMGSRHCEQCHLIAQHDPPLHYPGRVRGYGYRRFSIHRTCLPYINTVYANSISVGEWRYIYSATDGIGVTAKAGRLTLENPTTHKKAREKALIPLPPTGFVSFFFAKSVEIQKHVRLRLAGRLREGLAISLTANF
jgi:hypothetical protein